MIRGLVIAALLTASCGQTGEPVAPSDTSWPVGFGDSLDLAAKGESIAPKKRIADQKERNDTPDKKKVVPKPIAKKPEVKKKAVKPPVDPARARCTKLVDHVLAIADKSMIERLLPDIDWSDDAKAKEALIKMCLEADLPDDWVECILAASEMPEIMECGPPPGVDRGDI